MVYSEIVNAKCYLADQTPAGVVKSFKIRELEWQTIEIESLGKVTIYNPPIEVTKVFTGSMQFSSIETKIGAQAYNSSRGMNVWLKSNVDITPQNMFELENPYTVVTKVSLRLSGVATGTKLCDLAGHELEFRCHRLSQRVQDNFEDVFEIDVFANAVRNSTRSFGIGNPCEPAKRSLISSCSDWEKEPREWAPDTAPRIFFGTS